MEITTLQIVLVFIVACIAGMGSILDEFQFHRPLIACTLVGIVLGDMKTGIIIGGTLEIGAGIALAIPLAAAGQVLTIIVRTITVAFQHAADKAADNGNLTAISWIHVSSLFLQAMRVAIPAVIVALSVGTSEVQNMLNAIPEVVTNGLNIAGGMIVVVGYAMVINMMRAGYLMPFFYLGFVTAAFTNFNLVALGVIGTVMAPRKNSLKVIFVASSCVLTSFRVHGTSNVCRHWVSASLWYRQFVASTLRTTKLVNRLFAVTWSSLTPSHSWLRRFSA